MRAVVICGGYIGNHGYIRSKIHDDDFIICADSGYNHAKKMGLKPDVLIGDFDSAEGYEEVEDRIEYPVRKDFTDGFLAVDYAVSRGYEDIVIVAATGDRLDHTLTDIFLLSKCVNGVLIDDNNEAYLLRDRIEICGRKGQTVSIIPVNGDAEGLVTEGLEYPLNGETLRFGESRGVSNIMLENKCAVSLRRGMALVIKVENT